MAHKHIIICDKCNAEKIIAPNVELPNPDWGDLIISGYKYHICPECAKLLKEWMMCK